MKKCLGCFVTKPLTEYHTKRGKPQPRCKACRAIYMSNYYKANRDRERVKRKEWYEANKEYVKKKDKIRTSTPEFKLRRRLTKYGITEPQYYDVLSEQNNACGICKNIFSETPAFDHCHTTNAFRGLLCDNCNTGIGLLNEHIPNLEEAILYLRKYQK